jgi:predicted anti-sigma-YlaC factor YlaD
LTIFGYLLVSHHHYHTHHHHSIIIIIAIIAIIAIPDLLTSSAPPRWSRTEAQVIVHEMGMKCIGSGGRVKWCRLNRIKVVGTT